MSSLDWTPEGGSLSEFCSASDLTPRSVPKGKKKESNLDWSAAHWNTP